MIARLLCGKGARQPVLVVRPLELRAGLNQQNHVHQVSDAAIHPTAPRQSISVQFLCKLLFARNHEERRAGYARELKPIAAFDDFERFHHDVTNSNIKMKPDEVAAVDAGLNWKSRAPIRGSFQVCDWFTHRVNKEIPDVSRGDFLKPLQQSAILLGAAPCWNTDGQGRVCQCSMRVPDEVNVDSIGGREEAYFSSEFTHAFGAVRLTSHPGGFLCLWSSPADGPDKFPTEFLTDAKQTLVRRDKPAGSRE